MTAQMQQTVKQMAKAAGVSPRLIASTLRLHRIGVPELMPLVHPTQRKLFLPLRAKRWSLSAGEARRSQLPLKRLT